MQANASAGRNDLLCSLSVLRYGLGRGSAESSLAARHF